MVVNRAELIDEEIRRAPEPMGGRHTNAKRFGVVDQVGGQRDHERQGMAGVQQGLGLGLHERPIISRLNSLDHPMELEAGMVFAVETYCPATDGASAARIEEEVIVTPKGAQIITLFPADELPIANRY